MSCIVAIIATYARVFVAINATDPDSVRSYNGNMARKAKYTTPPAAPINQWVRDALEHSGLSQAEMARRLFERKAISADDRSMVNKMANFRDVTADEALAIAEITGFPLYTDSSDTHLVPLVAPVSAGALMSEDFRDEILDTLTIGGIGDGDWIALKVSGDSMDRISPPESIIVINRRDKRLVANACYVIADEDGGTTYKRYRPDPMRFEPVSTNPTHEPIFPEHEPTIIGRVKRSFINM